MSEKREFLNTLLFEKNNKINGGIYNKMQVDFAYNSNHIEGSRLSHEQTRYIFETQSIDGTAFVNDIFEASNHFRCFDFILDTIGEKLSENYIKKIHYILKSGLAENNNSEIVIGDYKKYANTVGGIETVEPERVSEKMNILIQKYADKKTLIYLTLQNFIWSLKKYTRFMTEMAG